MTDKANIPDTILENRVVGYGLSSRVLRFDAVAKCYLSRETDARAREITVYQRLISEYGESHDCIVPFYGVLDGSLLLQFQPNGSIRQYRTRQQQPVPLQTLLLWAEQTAKGVEFLHSKKVLHGDLSCNNIFLDADLNARIGDFAGSSIDGLPFLTVYEISHALPNDTSVSIKRELFALGSTLYELMTGYAPFYGKDTSDVERLFSRGQFPSLEKVPVVDQVILRCWKGQYNTATDVLKEIHESITLS
ncbi:hypothetical protein ACRALDRAFT_1065303 [Sodiomyces alcalophilus JCM 7366]|uniref:uncharacterized protein n=1 Tax=Sodiomyces alcalophilus JCM 7366 TaxID=591952 RepID=UPI0039B3D083